MNANLRLALKGSYASLIAFAVYSVTVGAYIALMLLVISMEEGGSSLSQATVPLTQVVILASQGSGFRAGVLTMTVMPLGLTLLLISLLAALIRRFGVSWEGLFCGWLVWLVGSFLLQDVSGLVPVDTTLVIEFRLSLIYLSAYLIASFESRQVRSWLLQHWWKRLPDGLRTGLAAGLKLAVYYVTILALIALITLLTWVVLYHDSVLHLFTLSDMGTGSRIVTSIAALAWLPNLCLWALSWLTGAGFAIGDLATFTLWSGHSQGLPALPLFGLFPEPVPNAGVRTAFVLLPLVLAFCLSFAQLTSKGSFNLWKLLGKHGLRTLDWSLLGYFVNTCLGLIVSAAIIVGTLALSFFLSSGALGEHRLAHVGIDWQESLLTLAQPTLIGFAAAFSTYLVVAAVLLAWRNSVDRIRNHAGMVSTLSQAYPRQDVSQEAHRMTPGSPSARQTE